jgi:hypothetical protein
VNWEKMGRVNTFFFNPKDSSYLYLLPSLLVIFLAYYLELFNIVTFLYPRSPKGERGILFYLCPSKIFFVAFFSVTVDGRSVV